MHGRSSVPLSGEKIPVCLGGGLCHGPPCSDGQNRNSRFPLYSHIPLLSVCKDREQRIHVYHSNCADRPQLLKA